MYQANIDLTSRHNVDVMEKYLNIYNQYNESTIIMFIVLAWRSI